MEFSSLIIGLLAYLIGAIPTGYLIAQLKGIADIRAHGSGNIGATNVSRLLGIHYFFIIFILDAGKAFMFLHVIQSYVTAESLYVYAALLLFGNGCSIFLHGSGGKGVATAFGLLCALNATTAIVVLGIWLCLLALTQTVGLASIGATVALPIYVYTIGNSSFFLFSLFVALWIIKKHQSNIQTYWNNR